MLRASAACARGSRAPRRAPSPRLTRAHAPRSRAPARSRTRASLDVPRDTETNSSPLLENLLGESLSTSGRASDATRGLIELEIQRLERDPGPEAPIASRLLQGNWKLRYTSSPGTVGAIAGWETFAGAVTDVRQTCAVPREYLGSSLDGESVTKSVVVTNVVTVALPLVSGEVRITQTFQATALSKKRWRVQLRTSDVDVGATGSAFREKNGDRKTNPFLSLSQPGADLQPSKTQLVTHLSRDWRVVRETTGNAVSVYSRERGEWTE